MSRLQPSGGIRNVWNGSGFRDESRVKGHCGTCNQAFTPPSLCRCECHMSNPKETER